MNTTEMMYEFQSLVESALPVYKDEMRLNSDKIMMHLNIGYRRYMLEKYLSSKDSNTNALTIQDHQDELYKLINTAYLPVTPIANGSLQGIGYNITLPTDYYYYIRADLSVTRNDMIYTTGSSQVGLNLTNSYKTFENAKKTMFNTPVLREPIAILQQNNLAVITDSNTSPKGNTPCTLLYLKIPKNLGFEDTDSVTTTPEIAESIHEEIVKFSYELFMNNISFANRVNTKNNDN